MTASEPSASELGRRHHHAVKRARTGRWRGSGGEDRHGDRLGLGRLAGRRLPVGQLFRGQDGLRPPRTIDGNRPDVAERVGPGAREDQAPVVNPARPQVSAWTPREHHPRHRLARQRLRAFSEPERPGDPKMRPAALVGGVRDHAPVRRESWMGFHRSVTGRPLQGGPLPDVDLAVRFVAGGDERHPCPSWGPLDSPVCRPVVGRSHGEASIGSSTELVAVVGEGDARGRNSGRREGGRGTVRRPTRHTAPARRETWRRRCHPAPGTRSSARLRAPTTPRRPRTAMRMVSSLHRFPGHDGPQGRPAPAVSGPAFGVARRTERASRHEAPELR